MKILITGGTGFVGSHLLDQYIQLKEKNLYAIKRWRSPLDNIKHLMERVHWLEADITDASSIEKINSDLKPDVIHHLAGQSFVPASWEYPSKTFQVNAMGAINILEAVRKYSSHSRVQIASSSEIYGKPDKLPITEMQIPKPMSPYGVSKLAMDRMGVQYYYSYGLKVIVTRGFNHTGPRRGSEFVCSSFAKQLVEIKKDKKDYLSVGNLEAVRDFTDVRDMCRAYIYAVMNCKPGEPYNISSGGGIKIKEVLNLLINIIGIRIRIKKDKSRMRPSDVSILVGDSTKFRKQTGWKPEIKFTKTLTDLLQYWEDKLNNESSVHSK